MSSTGKFKVLEANLTRNLYCRLIIKLMTTKRSLSSWHTQQDGFEAINTISWHKLLIKSSMQYKVRLYSFLLIHFHHSLEILDLRCRLYTITYIYTTLRGCLKSQIFKSGLINFLIKRFINPLSAYYRISKPCLFWAR